MFGLRPRSVGAAGTETTRAACTLVGRSTTHVAEDEFRHSGVRVESWRAGKSRVDDDTHTVNRQRALRNVGGEHDAPATRLACCECGILFVLAEGAGEGEQIDVRIDDA